MAALLPPRLRGGMDASSRIGVAHFSQGGGLAVGTNMRKGKTNSASGLSKMAHRRALCRYSDNSDDKDHGIGQAEGRQPAAYFRSPGGLSERRRCTLSQICAVPAASCAVHSAKNFPRRSATARRKATPLSSLVSIPSQRDRACARSKADPCRKGSLPFSNSLKTRPPGRDGPG
jgi:hypothetical protein